MAPEPGWYPDPHVPLLMRWWDGSTWTDDTYERTEPMQTWGPATGSTVTVATPVGIRPAPTTEDGVAVASWWPRAGARVVDWLLTGLITWLVGFSYVRVVYTSMSDQFDAAFRAAQEGTTAPPLTYDEQTVQAVLVLSLLWVLVSLAYNLVFLRWRAATPGKLVFGLLVRPWTPGERLTVGQIVRRWLSFEAITVLPYLGVLYPVVDCLWPLRDPRRQALHDKFAGTVVVRAADQRRQPAEG